MEEVKIKTRVIGIDVGVETTTFAIVDIRGNIVASDNLRTADYQNVNDFVGDLSERIVVLAEANGGYETIRSVGISAPSANFVTGCIENAANLSWKGIIPLAAMLRDRLGLAVALANDAHITALGEHVFGSAHGMKDFIIISLGHGGIGSCIFSNGQPHLGVDGFAGEVGHACVINDGRQCGCGNKGCLEAYSSEKGILESAKELLDEHPDKPSLMRGQDELTIQMLVEFCEQGDELAIEVLRNAGLMLGVALANFASVIDPEAIILTGSLTHVGKWLFDPLRESFEEHVFHNIKGKVRILVSILNDKERDVLGASALAWDVKEYSLFK